MATRPDRKTRILSAVVSWRERRDFADASFHDSIRAAHAAGATLRDLEGPSGLKKSRLADIVKGEK